MSTSDEAEQGSARPRATEAPRVVAVEGGPLLVEGPVEVVLPDGTTRMCERPVIALCACRRSLRLPFCDTSHRRRQRGVRPLPSRTTTPPHVRAEGTERAEEGLT